MVTEEVDRSSGSGEAPAGAAPKLVYGLDPKKILAEIKAKIGPMRLKPWEADDVAQDVLVSVIEQAAKGASIENPTAFIKRAAWNACLTRIRNERNDRRKVTRFGDSVGIPPSSERPDDALLVKEVLDGLDDSRLRAILVLGVLSEAKLEEVRRAMGLARRPARTLFSKLTRTLEVLLGERSES